MVFRRKWGSSIWLWRPDCKFWPGPLESEERASPPPDGVLCFECAILDQQAPLPPVKTTETS